MTDSPGPLSSRADRPVAYTRAPASASARTIPRPTPAVPPVTTAVWPLSVCIGRIYREGPIDSCPIRTRRCPTPCDWLVPACGCGGGPCLSGGLCAGAGGRRRHAAGVRGGLDQAQHERRPADDHPDPTVRSGVGLERLGPDVGPFRLWDAL